MTLTLFFNTDSLHKYSPRNLMSFLERALGEFGNKTDADLLRGEILRRLDKVTYKRKGPNPNGHHLPQNTKAS